MGFQWGKKNLEIPVFQYTELIQCSQDLTIAVEVSINDIQLGFGGWKLMNETHVVLIACSFVCISSFTTITRGSRPRPATTCTAPGAH